MTDVHFFIFEVIILSNCHVDSGCAISHYIQSSGAASWVVEF